MRLLPVVILLFFCACSPQPDLRQDLVGKWNMIGVKIYEEDASPILNPAGDRWLSFTTDGTFTSGSGGEQENAGTYSFDEDTRALALNSDAGPGDDSNWTITIRQDTLLMRGVGTPRQESSEVVLVR